MVEVQNHGAAADGTPPVTRYPRLERGLEARRDAARGPRFWNASNVRVFDRPSKAQRTPSAKASGRRVSAAPRKRSPSIMIDWVLPMVDDGRTV